MTPFAGEALRMRNRNNNVPGVRMYVHVAGSAACMYMHPGVINGGKPSTGRGVVLQRAHLFPSCLQPEIQCGFRDSC